MKKILMNIVGSSLLAFGVCAFIVPFDIIAGGATGLSIITHKLVGIPMSATVLFINLVCLPIGYIFGSKELVYGSLLSSFVYPIALAFFENIPFITQIVDNIFLAVLCGGIVCGMGIGLVMKSGGSTGGVDIPCLLASKYLKVPVNTVINVVDTCIMIGQVPFSNVTYVIYGLIYTYFMTNSISRVLTMGVDKYQVDVISEFYEQIAQALLKEDYGITLSYVQSGYRKKEIKKIECVVDVKRLRNVQAIIEEIDNTAFVTVNKVVDVKGRGYTLEKEWL
ncbi:YitT family protein [Floccifex sp.]|uniref:YitT family protein n=1 Tax=Floccifex sp. TaxID=2815810 RepID=UPI002A763A72|nr:YitT family protein [Floccifex sp.]MDD7281421.1 YitT family protein [Erysipelotrichaceae bacterium]MDY2957801.1 YitT family protein [Floccifex sp.]